jgi:hypothetical protein
LWESMWGMPWGQRAPPDRWYPSTRLHGTVTPQVWNTGLTSVAPTFPGLQFVSLIYPVDLLRIWGFPPNLHRCGIEGFCTNIHWGCLRNWKPNPYNLFQRIKFLHTLLFSFLTYTGCMFLCRLLNQTGVSSAYRLGYYSIIKLTVNKYKRDFLHGVLQIWH